VSYTGNAGISTGETLGYGFDVGSQPISIYSLGLWSWNNTTSWVEGSQLGIWDLQILSLTLFEKMPISQALAQLPPTSPSPDADNHQRLPGF